MPVEARKDTAITNADAATQTNTRLTLARGVLREDVGTFELTATDSIGSTYRFARLKSSDRVSRVLLSCDAIATSGAMDVGIYRTAQDGGAVVDVDFFASAVVLTSALNHSDITHEADPADAGAGYGQADVEKPLWQALGLAVDPMVYYDLTATATAAPGGAGTMSFKVQYVGNE